METIDRWFFREVVKWRTGAAIAWSILVLPLTCIIYMFLSGLQILHPFQCFTDFLTGSLSMTIFSTVILVMMINAVFFIYSKSTYTVISNVSITRFSQLSQLFKGPIILYSCVCGTCGLLLGWACTCLLGGQYSGLSIQCAENGELYCINEHHLFLVQYGGYTGLMYIMYHYIGQNNVLQFPTLQLAKYFRVRGKMYQTFGSSLWHVLWQIKYYYILYYLFGGIPRDSIAETLSLKFGTGSQLDSLYGLLFNFGLFWQTLLVGMFIQFSWSFGALLYNIYNTEYYEFPISSMFENFKNKCLVDALSCTKLPLVQALGFMDLNMLSRHSYSRRKELFCLSQPGGHPHNWNKILAVCLSAIQELNDTVQEANWKILANAPVSQPNSDISGMNGATNGLKQRLSSSDDGNTKSAVSHSSVKDKIVSGIKKRSFLSFFSSDTPDVTHKNLFASAFIQIWAVEALSTLVSASYHEDSFGVVQMSLKDIIIVILNLQENIDKHFKLTGGVTRRVQKGHDDIPLKYSLQTSLKSSIYSIVNTFGRHLMDIDLPVETEKKLRYFLEYRE